MFLFSTLADCTVSKSFHCPSLLWKKKCLKKTVILLAPAGLSAATLNQGVKAATQPEYSKPAVS